MARLAGRQAKLVCAAPGSATQIEIESGQGNGGLRVVFKIVKTDKKDPNTSEVTVYNLNPSSRAELQQKGTRVQLSAGYTDTGLSRIFVGSARFVDHIRSGGDWTTKFQLGDGEQALRFARAQQTFDGGTSAADVIRYLVGQSGLADGNTAEAIGKINKTYDHGYMVTGPVARSLDKIIRALNLTWSVQDGAIQILAPGEVANKQVPEISPDSGLIGSPEMGTPDKKTKQALIHFKHLLMPAAPGGKVKLKSERYDGYIRIKKVTFDGDTHSGPFYTEIEGLTI